MLRTRKFRRNRPLAAPTEQLDDYSMANWLQKDSLLARAGNRNKKSIERKGQSMAAKQPNILILWGDDIGMWNISHFSRGMMGYQTPNIDRVAKEGVTFTDYYAQQSCTAGRACFITGQNPIRTGLTKVGMPGATVGLQKEDPTI